ncbi:hypothetical protein AVEN_122181-1, partial [Araneus ventricosus]
PKRGPGRPGHLGGVDKKLTDKEERVLLRAVSEENRRIKYVSASISSASYEPFQEDSSSNSGENMDSGDFPTLIENFPIDQLKDNWISVDLTKIQCYRETMELFRSVPELEDLFDFYRAELKNVMVRDDYRELIELSIVFLGEDAEKNLKSDLQVPCMAQAIYSLKLSLFSSQPKLNTKYC